MIIQAWKIQFFAVWMLGGLPSFIIFRSNAAPSG
jgi:hypothetical protein